MAGRKIAIAIDDSDCSLSAAQWAVNVLVRPQDEVHLVAVRAVVTGGLATVTPLGTAGTVAALTQSYHQAVADEELKVSNMLTTTAAKVLKRRDAHKHMLPPAGGASGVAESIVSWAKAHQVDLLVVGSRGMGATKSTLMSLVGLGSVSNYCLHHLESTAVCVVQGKEAVIKKAQGGVKKKVLVPVDDSDMAKHAQQWAIDNVFGPEDELHLVAVALPVPYAAGVQMPLGQTSAPAGDFEAEYRGSMEHAESTVQAHVAQAIASKKIATEDAVAAHVLEAREMEAAEKHSQAHARDEVHAAVEAAAEKVPKERIFFKALEPEGGASEIGLSIKHYAHANGIDLVVMGSRGMGAFKRAMFSFLGLGSVSDWCVHNLELPVVIVRGETPKEP